MLAKPRGANNGYRAQITRLTEADLIALEPRWRELEARCECSFFQSWSWMGNWLAFAIHHVELYLFEYRRPNETIALATLSRKTLRRRGVFRITQLTLNDSAHKSGVGMNIEYNDLLVSSENRTEAWSQMLESIDSNLPGWDELVLNSLPTSTFVQLPQALPSHVRLNVEEEMTPWVTTLDDNTENIETFLKRLSKSRRWQIRRSIKEYEASESITVSAPETAAEALDWFSRLGDLHTERWNKVGQPGSFAFPNWVKFHHQLITNCFNRQEVQLLRIHCQDRDIGYIYSFVWRNWVYMMQTGLANESSNLLRPGYVSHLMAIIWNRKIGNSRYDFMCGEAEYKKTLATDGEPLNYLTIQKKSAKLGMEQLLRKTYRNLRRAI